MKIYVATHKPFGRVLPENYEYIQVNAANNPHFCPLTDDTGDHISEKNPHCCELTAIYWIWKNDTESDIVGLAHYRRLLTKRALSSSQKHYADEKDVTKWLNEFDMIASRRQTFGISVEAQLQQCVHAYDLILLRQTIERVAPDYLQAYDTVIQGKKTYLCNLFICKKERWDEYCEWLFSILFEMEKNVDMTGYSVQEQRLYGYLAERLFTVYVLKNGLRIKELYTHIVGDSKLQKIKNKFKQKVFGR